LSNSGETLILKNHFSQTVDSVSYSDSIPWPPEADGDGYSLEITDLKLDNSLVSNWRISGIKNGTPFKSETNQNMNAVLYPNPFNSYFYIETGNQELAFEPFRVEIFNLDGRKVKSIETVSYGSKIKIHTGNLNRGIYFIKIESLQKTDFGKQIIKGIKL
jgi:hypothetical protein